MSNPDHDRLREAIGRVRKAESGTFYVGSLPSKDGVFMPLDEARALATAAESTLPTKAVVVWRVECAQLSLASKTGWVALTFSYESEAEARGHAAAYGESNTWRCVRVTGPHQQEIPA